MFNANISVGTKPNGAAKPPRFFLLEYLNLMLFYCTRFKVAPTASNPLLETAVLEDKTFIVLFSLLN